MCVVTTRKKSRGKTLPNIVSLLTLETGEAVDGDGEDVRRNESATKTTVPDVDNSKIAAAVAVANEIEDDIAASCKAVPLSLPLLSAVVSTSTLSLAAAAAALPVAAAADQQRALPPCSKPKLALSHRKPQYHAASNSSSRRHSKKDVPHVDHSYHEHMNDCLPSQKKKIVTRGGVVHPFPVKLHFLLDQIHLDGKEDVIGWMEHGRSFMVHRPKEFVESVMPEYFKQTKFASFQRQLNLYGFKRITSGHDRNAYYHELFLRGKPFLGYKIKRQRVKGTGVRMASSPETEPNFYKMSYVGINYKPVRINVDGTTEKALSFHPVEMEQHVKRSTKGVYKTKQQNSKTNTVKEGDDEKVTTADGVKADAASLGAHETPPPEASTATPPPALERSSPLPSPSISLPCSPPHSACLDAIVDMPTTGTDKGDDIVSPVAQLEKPINVDRRIPPKKRRTTRSSNSSRQRKRTKDERNVCINPVTMVRISPTSAAAALPIPAPEILASTPYSDQEDDTNSVEEFQSTICPIEENKSATVASNDDIDEVQFCGCIFHYMAHLDREQLNDIEAAGAPSPPPPCMDIPNFKPVAKSITPSSSWNGPLCSRCSPRPLPPPALLSAPYFPVIEKPVLRKSLSIIVSDDDEGKGKQKYVEPKRSSEDEMSHFFESLGLPYDYLEDVETHEMLDSDEKLGTALESMLERC